MADRQIYLIAGCNSEPMILMDLKQARINILLSELIETYVEADRGEADRIAKQLWSEFLANTEYAVVVCKNKRRRVLVWIKKLEMKQ